MHNFITQLTIKKPAALSCRNRFNGAAWCSVMYSVNMSKSNPEWNAYRKSVIIHKRTEIWGVGRVVSTVAYV